MSDERSNNFDLQAYLNMDESEISSLSGHIIALIQRALSGLGFYVTNESHNYYADGIVGPATTHGLRLAAEGGVDYALENLVQKLGNDDLSRTDIMHLQTDLHALGYESVGAVDGIFGPQTTSAMVQFLGNNPEHISAIDSTMMAYLNTYAERSELEELFADHPAALSLLAEAPLASAQRTAIPCRYPEYDISVNERQSAVNEAITNAAHETGVDPDFMRALWGYESGFGTNLVSNTGCEGDWQFSQATWDTIMERYGDDIAAHIQAEYPNKAEELLNNHGIDGSLNAYQYDPVVSTWAAAYLIQENARNAGIDPTDPSTRGMQYAIYNVGPGAAGLIQSNLDNSQPIGRIIDTRYATWAPARNNPTFFRGGADASEALGRYNDAIEQQLARHQNQFPDHNSSVHANAEAEVISAPALTS